ncbi:unnamed protein product [Angiostrongylus costaricensis]|uniref:YqgFc domain-containing protein n=1 Tax=Angiostrongylus costaricensis TaxID=334426 RepID=A0A0R3PQT8_ANGCS|nr:unnamed protein product [Angiostrongylus costaricensis]
MSSVPKYPFVLKFLVFRRHLISRAEDAAISCFAHNLRHLFWREGVNSAFVIALDPGFSACKAALLTPTGSVIETSEFSFNTKSFNGRAEAVLKEWTEHAGDRPVVVAIGNGKASLETQQAIASMIRSRKFAPKDVKFCVVPEDGASKYSITPLAEKDLPNMPPTQRSAVSIGRRLIDPMGEYVKIDPKHLGMGMYQVCCFFLFALFKLRIRNWKGACSAVVGVALRHTRGIDLCAHSPPSLPLSRVGKLVPDLSGKIAALDRCISRPLRVIVKARYVFSHLQMMVSEVECMAYPSGIDQRRELCPLFTLYSKSEM